MLDNVDSSEQREQEETNYGLSVNGTQLNTLALLGGMKFWRGELFEGPITDLTSLVLNKDYEAFRQKLNEAMVSDSRGAEIGKSILAGLEAKQELPIEDVVRGSSQSPFVDFILSIPGKRLDFVPDDMRRFWLTDLGTTSAISPQQDILTLNIENELPPFHHDIELPLKDQHPVGLDGREVLGTRDEQRESREAVFAALRENNNTICTHVTSLSALTEILSAGHMGIDYPNVHGFYVENFAMDRLDLTDEERRWPYHFQQTGSSGPLLMMTENAWNRRKNNTVIIDGGISMNDHDLIGFWMPPKPRAHLLNWIGTWSEDKRQEVFKSVDPASIFISTPEDVATRQQQLATNVNTSLNAATS